MGLDKPIWYRYTFILDNGSKKVFEVQLDSKTLNIIPKTNGEPPIWARLDYSPCDHCPLNPAKNEKYCPIAVNMAPVVESFKDIVSCQTTDVLMESEERNVFKKKVAVQTALYPLMGIYMSASGCPSMEKLKPLVRYHLPFSSVEETVYRVVSMYVLAQYIRMRGGLDPDWELGGIGRLYDQIKQVNKSFCARLQKAVDKDALVNAVVILDAFASLIKSPGQKSVDMLRQLFTPYLKEERSQSGSAKDGRVS
ncbi:MAG: hypothetical protein A3J74_04380 [Elusimicrobia bacterium RIFCSPHIGHO2_02_FULL_57_9]|nr:MAG: hypothetical protein A3J74_04380 [Elusimicrobia bacterium RIFCSPHIGHO2_02_FULL_57_9]